MHYAQGEDANKHACRILLKRQIVPSLVKRDCVTRFFASGFFHESVNDTGGQP
jgi:hypothetical protein